jgi:pimeloyl-ACP methyl ester carboxylesterase
MVEMKALLSLMLALGGAFALLWVVMVGFLWWQQDRLIFAGWGFRLVSASGIDPSDERLTWTTPDGVTLVGALRRSRQPSRGLLLAFSGNAEDADWRLRHLGAWLHDVDIATFFYRGFGPSGGRPDQTSIVADAVFVHDQLTARLKPARVVAAGFSLGSGVVAQLAEARQLDGAILVTPFDSIAAVAAQRYPWAPVRWLLRHPFHSDRVLRSLDLPVAVIGAARDHVVPPARTQALIEVLRRPILVRWVEEANHVSLYDQSAYREAFVTALKLLLEDGGQVSTGYAKPSLRRSSISSQETGRPM